MKSCYNNRGGMFVLRGTKWSFVYNGSLIFTFTGCNSSDLPPRRPRFVPKLVHLTFMVEKVAVGQNFPTSNSVFPHSSRCSIHLHLCVAVTGRTRDEAWEPTKHQCCFGNQGAWDRRVIWIFKRSLFPPRDLVVTLCDWVKQNAITFLDSGL